MNMSDEQKGRFTALHKRKADLGWAMVEHTGAHEFELYAADQKGRLRDRRTDAPSSR
jgi:hypothetical protein